ncbi:hypothetical protein LOAG_10100 [Loa loa]|uniref:SH2 domain-containing protein n=1 Tax=Loa loa TaxID=7209 RepID=A0A1S0TR32_LOALO|nr:hypothetical protein LOAG_10100 [Loa loa]EFO18396.1 hypothetical protein LOAG_10100 [Loa loa]
MSKTSSFRAYDVSNAVKVQNWFVGFITKPSVERFLKKEGEYLVYADEKSGCLKFILCVRSKKGCDHFTLTNDDNARWILDIQSDKTFDTIIELIQYYKTNMLPTNATFLVSPFEKPKWFLRNENVTYDCKTGIIGTGNFSSVYEGKLYGKISVALKVIHKSTGMI